MNEKDEEEKTRRTKLLRFAELAARDSRKITSPEEVLEMRGLLVELSLTEEQALSQAKALMMD